MIQTPASIKKLLIHAGVFIFILFNCATVIAQNAEGRYGFIEINSAGIIPLQNFNPNLEEANSTINAGSALTLIGGSAPVTTQINFGQGACKFSSRNP